MSQPLQSINLVAPGFKGVNTEDSPIGQDFSFADVADNAVIDKRGRIAARKGVNLFTTDRYWLGTDYVHNVHHFYDDAGNEEIFVTGNNAIFKATTTTTPNDTLVNITPAGYTVTGNNWKIVNFNEKAYFFQRGLEPLVYDDATGLRTFSDATGSPTNSALYCHEALAAYGRLFVVDNGTDTQTIYWSDLLVGTSFSGGSSGSIEVSKAWPDGYDEVRALVAHNDKLIILGKHSILVYGNAFSPSLMALEDTIAGVGCICRNSVQSIGTDVLFMSQDGLRSFGRTIQEKSLPLSDLSLNIKTELIQVLDSRTSPTASVYSPENAFYLITFPDQEITYCFDLKGRLENNAYRVTRWTGAPFKAYERKNTDGTVLVGTPDGLGEYSGYTDEFNDSGTITPDSYTFRYYSPALTFGDPSKLKFLKKLRPTLVGANSATVFVKWAYDFGTTYTTSEFTVGNQTPFYYNTTGSEYTVAEFTGGDTVSRPPVNTTGSGTVITIGLESEINGFALSLQEINVLALMGKTL
jgi:hypothetical protein